MSGQYETITKILKAKSENYKEITGFLYILAKKI